MERNWLVHSENDDAVGNSSSLKHACLINSSWRASYGGCWVKGVEKVVAGHVLALEPLLNKLDSIKRQTPTQPAIDEVCVFEMLPTFDCYVCLDL